MWFRNFCRNIVAAHERVEAQKLARQAAQRQQHQAQAQDQRNRHWQAFLYTNNLTADENLVKAFDAGVVCGLEEASTMFNRAFHQ